MFISACGGGGGGGTNSTATPAPNQSAAGVWQSSSVITSGPNTGNTIKRIAIVSSSGTFYTAAKNQNNGCAGIGFGQASVSGANLTGNLNGFVISYTTIPGVSVNCTYPDGTKSATGTISGNVTSGQSMILTSDGKTVNGTPLGASTDTFTWAPTNSLAPSLATVSGNYTSNTASFVSVNSSGAISIVDSTGCTISGTVAIPNPAYNVYDISYKYTNCPASYAALNNVVATGLATYDNTVNPNQLIYTLNATVNGVLAVEIGVLSK